jgi:hypothetical protein
MNAAPRWRLGLVSVAGGFGRCSEACSTTVSIQGRPVLRLELGLERVAIQVEYKGK